MKLAKQQQTLPKQWRHWCANAHLYPYKTPRRKSEWMYLRGRGYHWRVNIFWEFQRGDSYKDFDRWALCTTIDAPMPKSRDEFLQLVLRMSRES